MFWSGRLANTRCPEILHSWKSFTAKQINAALGREGKVWQDESFDNVVRDEAALEKFSAYIQENPAKASWLKANFAWDSEAVLAGQP